MASNEQPQKHSWWLNELESLGINTREENQLGDPQKTSELAVDIKQMFYEEYKKVFPDGSEWLIVDAVEMDQKYSKDNF